MNDAARAFLQDVGGRLVALVTTQERKPLTCSGNSREIAADRSAAFNTNQEYLNISTLAPISKLHTQTYFVRTKIDKVVL